MPILTIPALAWGIGAAIAAGTAAGWWGRGATEDVLEAYGPTPEIAPPFLVAPVAPVTGPEMTIVGRFTPEEMIARTRETQQIVNTAVNRIRAVEGSQDALRFNVGRGLVDEGLNPLVMVGAAAAALAVVLLVSK